MLIENLQTEETTRFILERMCEATELPEGTLTRNVWPHEDSNVKTYAFTLDGETDAALAETRR